LDAGELANAITVDAADRDQLLALLDGLPLAIAQAGAYLQESGAGLASYMQFYQQKWSDLMESDDLADAPLQDYPDRSVWTTWAISYQAIRNKNEATANLLLLWSFLDNKDLWFGLFARSLRWEVKTGAEMLSAWIGDIASSEIKFNRAMQLLRNYSLVEETIEAKSYTTHPVVHQWARHSQGKSYETKLCQLAIVTVGWAFPEDSAGDYYVVSRRLLSHVQPCFRYIVENKELWSSIVDERSDQQADEFREQEAILDAAHRIGNLYWTQGKLVEAEQTCRWVLRGSEKILGPTHNSTLWIVNNLGILYLDQGKLREAEQMYERALRGYKELLGPTHISTMQTVSNLGSLYAAQGKLGEADQIYKQALRGYEELFGPTHTSTLWIVNNLGNVYREQGKLSEAEHMYERVLQGTEELLGPTHISTLDTVNNLGSLYAVQGKLGEAEQIYKRVLRGYEEVAGTDPVELFGPSLDTVYNLGLLYEKRKEFAKAREYYVRARSGYSKTLGEEHDECKKLATWIDEMDALLEEAEAPVAVYDTLSDLAADGDDQNIVGAEANERRRLRAAEERRRRPRTEQEKHRKHREERGERQVEKERQRRRAGQEERQRLQ
jgi:tetratricopeptide (TPR) repeat protein